MSISGLGGLNNLAGSLNLNLNRATQALSSDTVRLSSGLRINSAADDPAGLAISVGLHAKVSGYDQASSNIQDANNALTVADGALQTITDILQRIRTLAVSANTSLLSSTDAQALQTEVDQLQQEINGIAGSTSYNRTSLLAGATSYYLQGPHVANATFYDPDEGGGFSFGPPNASWTFTGFAGVTAYSATSNITNGTYVGAPNVPSTSTQVCLLQNHGTISQTLSGFQPNLQYVIVFNTIQRKPAAQPTANQQAVAVEVDGQTIATYQPSSQVPPQWQTIITPPFTPANASSTIKFAGKNTNQTLFIDDVQVYAVVYGSTLNIQSGADEGQTQGVFIHSAATANLGLLTLSVLDVASASATETSVDVALNIIGTNRALIGAQIVGLNEQAANNATASVNLTASGSAISDTDIAKTATSYSLQHALIVTASVVLDDVDAAAATSVEGLFK